MTEKELVVLAKEAMEYAYSPYSKFKHHRPPQQEPGLRSGSEQAAQDRAGDRLRRSSKWTEGTSTTISMRSSMGPEMRLL